MSPLPDKVAMTVRAARWRARLRVLVRSLPFLSDTVLVQFDPYRVSATRVRRGKVVAQHAMDCEWVTDGPDWSGAMAALKKLLDLPSLRDATADFVLSNHFARFRVAPWREDLNGDAERTALVRHQFTGAFGPAAQSWELRISETAYGAPALAVMIDRALLEALRGVACKAALRMRSIEPLFAAAFNRSRVDLGDGDCWFMTLERGRLCVAHLTHSRWQDMRCQRIGDDWRRELPVLLARERLRASASGEGGRVHLYAPGIATRPLLSGEWTPAGLKMPAEAGLDLSPTTPCVPTVAEAAA